jgi:hypothetical protein
MKNSPNNCPEGENKIWITPTTKLTTVLHPEQVDTFHITKNSALLPFKDRYHAYSFAALQRLWGLPLFLFPYEKKFKVDLDDFPCGDVFRHSSHFC